MITLNLEEVIIKIAQTILSLFQDKKISFQNLKTDASTD